jgi:hypothetical protein
VQKALLIFSCNQPRSLPDAIRVIQFEKHTLSGRDKQHSTSAFVLDGERDVLCLKFSDFLGLVEGKVRSLPAHPRIIGLVVGPYRLRHGLRARVVLPEAAVTGYSWRRCLLGRANELCEGAV